MYCVLVIRSGHLEKVQFNFKLHDRAEAWVVSQPHERNVCYFITNQEEWQNLDKDGANNLVNSAWSNR